MKKRMVKLGCIAMVFALLVCLAGCGGNDAKAFIGTWQCRINMAEQLNTGLATDPEVADYLMTDEFYLNMNIEFREDGTYTLSIDEDSLKETMSGYMEVMKEGLSRYLEDMMKDQFNIEMTVDEILSATGLSLEDLMAEIPIDELMDELLEAAVQEGKYMVKDGKLFTSVSLDTEVDPRVYETYELSGKTLTLLELVGAEADDLMTYPIVFEKIS